MLNSPMDVAILFGVALLVFGPKRLPELGKSLGQGIGNFKKSLQDAQDEVKNAVKTEPSGSQRVEEGASIPQPPRVQSATAVDESSGSPGR